MIGDIKLRSWSVFQRTEVHAAGAMQVTLKKKALHSYAASVFHCNINVQFSYLLLYQRAVIIDSAAGSLFNQ